MPLAFWDPRWTSSVQEAGRILIVVLRLTVACQAGDRSLNPMPTGQLCLGPGLRGRCCHSLSGCATGRSRLGGQDLASARRPLLGGTTDEV